jgi:hypothetical protein
MVYSYLEHWSLAEGTKSLQEKVVLGFVHLIFHRVRVRRISVRGGHSIRLEGRSYVVAFQHHWQQLHGDEVKACWRGAGNIEPVRRNKGVIVAGCCVITFAKEDVRCLRICIPSSEAEC